MANFDETETSFKHLVHSVLNERYSLGLQANTILNSNGVTLKPDLIDIENKTIVEFKSNIKSIDRGNFARQITNQFKSYSQNLNNPRFILVFSEPLNNSDRKYYIEYFNTNLNENLRKNIAIFDRENIIELANKYGVNTNEFIGSKIGLFNTLFSNYKNLLSHNLNENVITLNDLRILAHNNIFSLESLGSESRINFQNKLTALNNDYLNLSVDKKIIFRDEIISFLNELISNSKKTNKNNVKHYLVGSNFGSLDYTDNYINNNIWENNSSDNYEELIKSVENNDVLFLVSKILNPTNIDFKITYQGLVKDNPKNGDELFVAWEEINSSSQVEIRRPYQIVIERIPDAELNVIQNKINSNEAKSVATLTTVNNTLSYVNVSNDHDFSHKDLLGFEKDVRSFASIMALKAVKPPLAIALFGNWGSGKSYFMNSLQKEIYYITFEKNTNELKELGFNGDLFCRGVLQIKFNAWSYLDANLWAGLVANIFEKIDEYITKETKGEKEKKKVRDILNKNLEIISSNRIEIEETKAELDKKKKTTEIELNKLNETYDKLIQNIENKKLEIIVEEIHKKVQLDDVTKEQLNKYGITPDKINELSPNALLDEVKSWATFFKNLFQFSGKAIILLVLAALILLFLYINPDNIIDKINLSGSKGIITFFSIVGPIFVSFYDAYKRFKKLLHPLTKFKDEFNKEMETAKFNFKRDSELLNSQIARLDKQIKSTTKELEEIQLKEEEIEYESKYSITKRAFYSFIKAKSKDEKYEKHLGIISTIRRDFETLSELFIEDNTDKNEKHNERKTLKEQFNNPLDRIILYIDDLDRCSEEKVLEVLQAVHLLMAFPLFIVVVGVDKRCVNNALNYKNIVQYRSLTNTMEDLKEQGIEVIEPNEYLEKIFQIPFHIQQTTSYGAKNMIDNLLTGQVVVEDLEFKNGDISIESLIQEIPEEDFGGWQNEIHRNAMGLNEKDKKNDSVLIENLTITGIEFTYLKEISWLIDSSPRSVKRFLNLYRIVRAHESLSYTKENRNDEFMVIMFLLGIANGKFSSLMRHLINYYIHATVSLEENNGHTLQGFFNSPDFSSKEKQLSITLGLSLNDSPNFKKLYSIHPFIFKKHLPFIQRFSFN